MSLVPLTPLGVKEKLKELYTSPDAALSLEAESVKLDFKEWMKNNFILDSDQINYLDNLANVVATYFGEQCSIWFLNRLEIELVYMSELSEPNFSKWTGVTSTLEVKANGGGDYLATGKLTFFIEYF